MQRFINRNAKGVNDLWQAKGHKKMPGGKMGSILGPVIVIALVCAGFVALFGIFQSNLIYFPSPVIEATPRQIDLSYEDIFFESEDGVRLSGWYIPAEEERGTVLFCHGNAGNISHRLDSILIFHRLGMSVLIFDYRGYGRSGGKPGERGTYLDARAAWQFLVEKKHVPHEKIAIFGRSLGGAIAAWLAKEHTPGVLLLESTFTSIVDIASDLYPYLPVKWLARFHYNALDYVSSVKCPILIAHSRNDDIIPFAHGERLFKAAGEPKQFLEMKGSHNDGFIVSGRAYVDGLNAFLAKYFDDRI